MIILSHTLITLLWMLAWVVLFSFSPLESLIATCFLGYLVCPLHNFILYLSVCWDHERAECKTPWIWENHLFFLPGFYPCLEFCVLKFLKHTTWSAKPLEELIAMRHKRYRNISNIDDRSDRKDSLGRVKGLGLCEPQFPAWVELVDQILHNHFSCLL